MQINAVTKLRLFMCLSDLLAKYGWTTDGIPNLYDFAKKNRVEIKYSNIKALGFFSRTPAGFLIELKELGNKPKLYEQKREYYTLAHELIHWLFYVHRDVFFRQLGVASLSKRTFENICEMLASYLIIPPEQLHQEVGELKEKHPEDMLKYLCSPDVFNANISPMVKRISQTGAVRESNHFISVFTYGTVPSHSRKLHKWRLLPDCLVLPRGIGKSRQIKIQASSIFMNPGLHWAGLDTLMLAPTAYAMNPNCTDLSNYFDQSKSNSLFFDETKPTYHVLNTLKESGAAEKNTICISPKRIAEEKKRHEIPVASSLLKKAIPPAAQWSNKKWRLYAYDLRAKKWHVPNQAARLLVTGHLGLVPR